ncbi:MAG TPA: sigma 54-interacting transcriptional regulator [Polyangiaceae bacterium]|jgi:DNA-binding NtrC family response regulator|nr:sigma 54-interacting transcriptional regulator [Polyangiaceae bacterium]
MPEPPSSSDFDDVSTVLHQRYEPGPEADGVFTVAVVEGADRGQRVTVDGTQPGPLLVGQGPACGLRLSDPHVSRRHASVEVVGARLRLTDLESMNGTHVDGVCVLGAMLRGGETVRVGDSVLRVERVGSTPAPVPSPANHFGRMIGASIEMRRLYPLAERLARSDVPVVIEGETGTGKEVLAESMHEHSARAGGPLVVFDCTSVPPNLIESELFGHERGAFTGAVAARRGFFEQAHGGTLLIDEIGDLALPLQAKLLRAIERSEIRRLGADGPMRIDVRILAATRRNLDREVQEGRFRDDLFHRLAVGRIELPSLRRRRGDIAVLARHFWQELGATQPLPNALLLRWEDYNWPGNVRELRNAVARQIALDDLPVEEAPVSGEVSLDASDVIPRVLALRLPLPMARLRVVDAFEQLYIEQVLAEHGGSVARAAAASGIARRYFQILRGRKRR